MLPHEGLPAPTDHRQLSEMMQKAQALRTALRRREPRCRICRDDAVRVRVDERLDWVGVPIILGPNKVHRVTYADILRDIEPLNTGRAKKDRITYNSIWVHAKRHYDLEGLVDHWSAKVEKEMEDTLGITGWGRRKSRRPGTNKVRDSGVVHTSLATILDLSLTKSGCDWTATKPGKVED